MPIHQIHGQAYKTDTPQIFRRPKLSDGLNFQTAFTAKANPLMVGLCFQSRNAR